jgi:hypothetical protein
MLESITLFFILFFGGMLLLAALYRGVRVIYHETINKADKESHDYQAGYSDGMAERTRQYYERDQLAKKYEHISIE